MATVTPAYSWPVPTSSDLVKDGATAIEALGDAIDASMNTALGTKKAGMVLLNTTSFSGVASQSINDVFSATYTNYKILLNQTSQTNSTGGNLRLRVAGADNSTTSSYKQDTLQFANSGAVSLPQDPNQTSFYFSQIGTTGRRTADIELFNPFDTVFTFFHTRGRSEGAINTAQAHVAQGYHNASTSFTGFTIFPDSGTFTGTVSVYGYNK